MVALKQCGKLAADPVKLLTVVAFAVEAGVKPHVHVITGNLRRSIHTRVEPHKAQARVGTNVDYAVYENALHPFMEPGVNDAQQQLDHLLAGHAKLIWSPLTSK